MSERRVALTFDAEHPSRPHCPPGNTEKVLEVLRGHRARATFFLQGRWARSYPGTALAIAADGHLIGHHSRYHAPLPLLTEDGIRADVEEGQADITQTSGADPRPWFRCPFGEGHDDPRVIGILEMCGYLDVGWHVDARDWDADVTTDEVIESVVAGSRSHGDGAVVLMHTWPASTPEALPAILSRLHSDGATLVGVDALEVFP